MSSGPKQARADVLALLTGLSGISQALDYEPLPNNLPRPTALTVSMAGFTATDWRVAVRIYVDTRTDVQLAQDQLDDLAQAADVALDSHSARADWEMSFLSEQDALVATTILDVPREDF